VISILVCDTHTLRTHTDQSPRPCNSRLAPYSQGTLTLPPGSMAPGRAVPSWLSLLHLVRCL